MNDNDNDNDYPDDPGLDDPFKVPPLFDLEHSNAPWARDRARDYGLEAAMITQARALAGLASVEDRLGGPPRTVTVRAYAIDETDGAVTFLSYTEGMAAEEGGGWFCTDAWFDPARANGRKAALAYIAREFPPTWGE